MLFLKVDTASPDQIKSKSWILNSEWRKGLLALCHFVHWSRLSNVPHVHCTQIPPPLSVPAPGLHTWSHGWVQSWGQNNQFSARNFSIEEIVVYIFVKLFNDSWFYPDWDNFLFGPLIHAFHLIKQFIFIWCLTNKIFVSAPVKLRRPRSNPDLKIIEDTGFLRMLRLGSYVITVWDNDNNDSDQAETGDVRGMLIMSLRWQQTGDRVLVISPPQTREKL